MYFTVWLSPVSATIGQNFNLQVNVKNTGLFDDWYNVSMATPTPNILLIDEQTSNTYIGPLKGDSYLSSPEISFSYGTLTVLTDEPCVCISVNSTTKADFVGIYNMNSVGCSPNCVQIKSKMASLPDFGLLGIIQIFLFAAILILLKF